MSHSGAFSQGDVFYTQSGGQYHIYKLLVNEAEFSTYHVLCYEPSPSLPAAEDLDNLAIQIHHAPIDAAGFNDPVLLTNSYVTATDLIGYHEYLKSTRDISEYVTIASDYYKKGYALTNDRQHEQAIDAYSKAIDLVPAFYEAIDNRAFCKMDQGRWEDAIEDFRQSLIQNPDSLLAEFSIGECYFKLGDYQQAKTQFEIAHQIDPNHQAPVMFLKKISEIEN